MKKSCLPTLLLTLLLNMLLTGCSSISNTSSKVADGLDDEVVSLNRLDEVALQKDTVSRQSQPTSFHYQVPKPLNDGLKTGSLYESGIDSKSIVELATQIAAGEYQQIDSLLISHRGTLLLEQYWRQGAQQKTHFVFSITKNMMSNAIGKAIELGFINSEEDLILDYFPEPKPEQLAAGIDTIRIKDLLTMSSGLRFVADVATPVKLNKENHVSHYLTYSKPVDEDKPFKYQGSDPDILNHILYNRTGETLAQFSQKYFFTPMGIHNVHWETSICGLTKASSGLHLTSRDMLKIGLTTMAKGQYHGQQLLNKSWLDKATSHQLGNGKYGYFWWTEDFVVDGSVIETISARGARGQFIMMMPALELVVVVTSNNNGHSRRQPLSFTPDYIVPPFLTLRAEAK